MLLRALLSVTSGVLFALAFPNAAIGWLAFIALAPLLVAIDRSTTWKQAFLCGWIAQTTAWLIMVPWVIRVMSHYGGLPQIVGILIFIAMALYLGLYGALFAYLVYRVRPGTSLVRWLIVPLAWAAVEYARTYLLTGFPWNLLATAIIDYTPLILIDRFAGPYFVGAMIVVPSAAIAWAVSARARGTALVFVALSIAVIGFVWWATGLVGSKLIMRPTGKVTHTAALLQPNISQEMRWDENNLFDIFERMMTMTANAVQNGADVVVWPESTVPLSYSRTDFYRDRVEQISRDRGIDVILGSVAEAEDDGTKLWNAAFLVSGGRTIGHYDKIKLVPFGEYVPLRKAFFFAKKLVRAVGEFQFGTNETPLTGKFRYGPAICYEIVYPQISRTQVRNGANVLVTITNDAWYDGTSAPRQHLSMARMRAVEDDRYLLRAGTTGISALVDPTGRIVQQIPMGQQGTIYAKFETRETVTPYVRFGDWFSWLAVVVTAAFAFWKRGGNVNRGSQNRNVEC